MGGRGAKRYRLEVLGSFRLSGADGPIALSSRKLGGLLTYLAVAGPRPIARETVCTLLWSSHRDSQAKQNLRQAIFRLRKVLGPDIFCGDGDHVSLNTAVFACDVSLFEQLVRTGGREALAEAVELCRGRLIEDIALDEEVFTDWLNSERERLLELSLGALVALAEQELAAGRGQHALRASQRAIALNRLREDAHRIFMLALSATGRNAEALGHYEYLSALLKRELDAGPDAETQSLAARLRCASTQPAPPAVPENRLAPPARSEHPSPDGEPGRALHPGECLAPAAVEAEKRQPPPAATKAQNSLEPHRRHLTVLACSMTAAADSVTALDPEQMVERKALFDRTTAEVASRHAGSVAQQFGSTVLIYFGYPQSQEHDGERAVRAGLALIDAVSEMSDHLDEPCRGRVGIATGVVVIGGPSDNVGTPQPTAIGETTNVATQLQALASPGQLLVCDVTRRLAGGGFEYLPLEGNKAVAFPNIASAWRVCGQAIGITRAKARRGPLVAPLIGRQEEVDLLRRRWSQAKAGDGRVVLLCGEPGIGKSRITEELIAQLGAEPHAQLCYHGSPHHTHSPLQPFIAQLEQAAGLSRTVDPAAKLDKLHAALAPVSGDATRDVSLIADLLSVPLDSRHPPLELSPQLKRELTLRALLRQIESSARKAPTLIVMEDVHWFDPTSLDLLDRIVSGAANLPVLLIVTFRPDFQPSWVGQPHVTMVSLNRLDRRDSAGMLNALVGGALPDAIAQQIIARTDGIPLFIEELTTSLLESGRLRETDEGFRLDEPLTARAIPISLQASMTSRLDHLGPAKAIAQAGAAIGREFSYVLIAAVSKLEAPDLEHQLEALCRSNIISRQGTPPFSVYFFKHAMLQEAAYATLLSGQRRRLHATIATTLRLQLPSLCEKQPEIIANHLTEAGLAIEAIGFWHRAGLQARASSATREAANAFAQALKLLDTLPDSRWKLEQSYEIRLDMRSVLAPVGEGLRALQCLNEAEKLADRLEDDSRRGRVAAYQTLSKAMLGQLDDAVATGTRGLNIARRLRDRKLQILTTSYLIYTHYVRAEFDDVIALAKANTAAVPAEMTSDNLGLAAPPAVWDRAWFTIALAECGRFTEAGQIATQLLGLAEPSRHAYTIGLANFAVATLRLLEGLWHEAASNIDRWMEMAKYGGFSHLPWGAATSAWAAAELGREGAAAEWLQKGERLIERQGGNGIMVQRAAGYHALARAALRMGRLDAAQDMAERALESSKHCPGFAAHTLNLLGDIATHSSRFDGEKGQAHYRGALALAQPRAMNPLAASCHLGLGSLYRRKRVHSKAIEHLRTAAAMFGEMDMEFWHDRVDEELHAVGSSRMRVG